MSKKKYAIGILFTTFLILLNCGCVHISTPEEGEHVGYITETGYRGLIWKTHYVKVVDSRFANAPKSSDYQGYWYYGVNEADLTLFNQAKEMKTTNEIVTISYRCDFIVPEWERSEGCILTGIRR